ncbi:hypothetical protein M9Y10_033685 [Tritrichomonas musculus]|uniref:Uncharacterized protein n=1 Tax=Tritrichomonas musculus TaxID=1915356 RepID=A0ABR2KCU0_9EUKA
MSFFQKLFNFFELKNDIDPPAPLYPFKPDPRIKRRQFPILLAKETSRSFATQTEQTISNLTTKESETDIEIPVSFIPKKISYSYLSSRFKYFDHEKNEILSQQNSFVESMPNNSEPEDKDHTKLDNTKRFEICIESDGSNDHSKNEAISGSQSLNIKNQKGSIEENSINNIKIKEEKRANDTFSIFNFKAKEEKNTSDTFSTINFKTKEEKKASDTFSTFNFKNKEEKNSSDTFSTINFKPVEDKKSSDTFSAFNFKNKEEKSSSDTFSTINLKPVEDKKSSDIFSTINFKPTDNKNSDTFSKINFKQADDKKSSDTFSSFNFKPKENNTFSDNASLFEFKPKENSEPGQTSTKAKTMLFNDIDIAAIKAKTEAFLRSTRKSQTTLETNLYSRQEVIRNESGGFSYTPYTGQHFERGGPKKSFSRKFDE